MASDNDFVNETISQVRSRVSDLPVLLLFGQFDPMRFVGSIRKFKEMFGRHSVTIIPLEEHFPILSSGEQVGKEVRQWIQRCQSDAGNPL
jgi:pimeloyl-ACP methyl ester carboxylesterase